jgi:hypothetical protein
MGRILAQSVSCAADAAAGHIAQQTISDNHSSLMICHRARKWAVGYAGPLAVQN